MRGSRGKNFWFAWFGVFVFVFVAGGGEALRVSGELVEEVSPAVEMEDASADGCAGDGAVAGGGRSSCSRGWSSDR